MLYIGIKMPAVSCKYSYYMLLKFNVSEDSSNFRTSSSLTRAELEALPLDSVCAVNAFCST